MLLGRSNQFFYIIIERLFSPLREGIFLVLSHLLSRYTRYVTKIPELRSYYRFHLAYRPFILFESLLDKVRRFFTHPIYLFLSTDSLLTLSFWTKNFFIARSLRKYYHVQSGN